MHTADVRKERVQIDVGRYVCRLPVRSEPGLDVKDVQYGSDRYEERIVREVASRADP